MTFAEVQSKDAAVQAILRAGGSLEDCVVALFQQKQGLIDQLQKLAMIAPRLYKMPDGTLKLWQCPIELIPIEDMSHVEPKP